MLFNHSAAGIAYSFDEPNLVSSAGLAPVLRLAQSAGLKRLADEWITVANTGADKGANPGTKITSLVAGWLLVPTASMTSSEERRGGRERGAAGGPADERRTAIV